MSIFRSKYKRRPTKGRRTAKAEVGWKQTSGAYGKAWVKYDKDYVYTRRKRKRRRK